LSIDVGHTLDKYELIEKVGQGGMAVVYRGLDTSLRREVAIKVLHHHLAEHAEARERFEREAQAVAKLRHENILEIFDFSGLDSSESYIVTEFIDGQTLKEFVTDHQIKFPEIGAMIALQVCRALGHAHSVGILHRDVKPENIMIRNDGVVKLTDFGIAQMVDLQRLTVTGQLLGSPAYMSPEHVEGKPLDFRTDVFAVGIVLYQLVTGELPFKGRNPHEILKRIAECKYLDPRVVNPRVGKELGGIIQRALEHDKDARYPNVSEMLEALEEYLSGSGLSEYADELARFFDNAVSYEMALKPRLLSTLSKRGKALVEDDRVAALEVFNRVLTLDPNNQEVLAEIDKLSRRSRALKLVLIAGGVVVLGAGVLTIKAVIGTEPTQFADSDAGPTLTALAASDATAEAPFPDGATPAIVNVDADPVVSVPDAGAGRTNVIRRRRDSGPKRRKADAGAVTGAVRQFTLTVSPRDSEIRVAGGAWKQLAGGTGSIELPAGDTTVAARNTSCCQERILQVPSGKTGGPLRINLRWLPGQITPTCDKPGVSVKVDGGPARLGRATTVVINNTFGKRSVKVVFFGDDYYKEQSLEVKAKELRTVKCEQ
jgi:serine/threonine-protein kinase